MATLSIYKKRLKADITNEQGGYRNRFLFAPRATFTVIAGVVSPYAALGDKVKITADHTFAVDDGFIEWTCKRHSATHTTEPVGDAGSQSLLHKYSVIVLGDGAATLEQMRELLNDDLICLMQDQDCAAEEYVQFGDECLSPDVKISFTGNTTKEGLKEYKLEMEVKDKKFFYSGDVALKP